MDMIYFYLLLLIKRNQKFPCLEKKKKNVYYRFQLWKNDTVGWINILFYSNILYVYCVLSHIFTHLAQ